MTDIRSSLDKIKKIELTEAFTQGANTRIPLQHLDAALEDIQTVKHWVTQAGRSSATLDMNSNVPNDKFLQKKLLSTLRDIEKVERDLNDVASFIQGIK